MLAGAWLSASETEVSAEVRVDSNGLLRSNTVIGTLALMGGLLHLVQRRGA